MEAISHNMSKKKPGIQKRQNEAEMQSLIVAQHFTYKCAKKWVLLVFFVYVVLPIGINIALYFAISDIHTGILALIALSLIFIGDFITKEIERVKKKAAMLQQKFDLHVFCLDIASSIDDNIVAEQQEKYKNRNWKRKENWYSNYESMDIDKAIFYSQRENIDWTSNIENRYRYFLVGIAIIALLSFGMNLVLNNSSVVKMLHILMTAIPLIIYAKAGYYKIKQDNENLANIRKFTDEIKSSINEISPDKLKNNIYILQIYLYKFRQDKYLIPDWFENRYYKQLQAIENRKAGQRTQLEKKRTSSNKKSQ